MKKIWGDTPSATLMISKEDPVEMLNFMTTEF